MQTETKISSAPITLRLSKKNEKAILKGIKSEMKARYTNRNDAIQQVLLEYFADKVKVKKEKSNQK